MKLALVIQRRLLTASEIRDLRDGLALRGVVGYMPVYGGDDGVRRAYIDAATPDDVIEFETEGER